MVSDQGLGRTFTPLVHKRQRGHDPVPLFSRSEFDALLDNVAGKFVFGEISELGDDEGDEFRSVLLSSVLNDMLSHIVAKLIKDE